jgi:hypothetical protein
MALTASEVASLKSALDCWEWIEYISTAIVILGCVGEFFAEFTHFPKSESRRHKLGKLSLLVVIAGIFGELCATVRTSHLSGLIIANVEQQASEANERAGKAEERAKASDLARIQLEAMLSPRRLSIAQQQAIADSCREFAGRRVLISSYAGDAEAMVLGEQIRAALHGARVVVEFDTSGLLTAGSLLKGVQVSGPNEGFRKVLESSLKNDGHLKIAGPEEKKVPEGSASMIAGAMSFGPSDASIYPRINKGT